jgi:hypothetical protein
MDTFFNVMFFFFALSGFIAWGIVLIFVAIFWATNNFKEVE